MYIKEISYNIRDLNRFDEVTIVLENVRPYKREALKDLYMTRSDVDICAKTNRINYFGGYTTNKETTDIKVTKVIYHNPATIVFWSDGTKTVVVCDKNDTYDPEKGFYIACAKKLFGNNYAAVGRINKALEMAEVKNEKRDSKENS